MKGQPILIGVDLGTSATKVVAFDAKGTVLASAAREYPLSSPQPGWAEQDPDDWWKAARESLREVTKQIDTKRLAGISFSGQMHGAVFLDASDRVIRPAMLWNDARTGPECARILEVVGRETYLSAIKNLPLASFTLPKLLWLSLHEPLRYCRLHTLLLPKDYVRFRLTGERAMDFADGAGTAMMEIGRGKWAEDILHELGLDPAVLPPLVAPSAVAGQVSAEAARLTGLPAGLPVIAGGGDQPVGAVGVGVFEEGQAMLSLGTSGVVLAPTRGARVAGAYGLASFDHAAPGRTYLMGCILAAGGALQWYRDALGEAEVAEIKKEKSARHAGHVTQDPHAGRNVYDLLLERAAEAPIGSEGLCFLPYLSGERTPHADPDARGAWVGLSTRHTKAHLTRSLIEGVSFALRDSLEAIRSHGIELHELRATGGGARNKFWLQMLADVLSVEIHPMKGVSAEEGPALGAAMLAGVGAGVYKELGEAAAKVVRTAAAIRPNPKRAEEYEKAYQRYRGLYPALKDFFAR